MDLFLIDQIMLSSLRTSGHKLPSQVEAYLSHIQKAFYCHHISANSERFDANHMVYQFSKMNVDPHRSFYEISEQILAFVIREKISRVFMVTPSVYAQILLHDLINVGAEIFVLNDAVDLGLPKKSEESFSSSITPLFFQHCNDYLNSIPKKVEDSLFSQLLPLMKSFRASTQDQNSEYLISVPDGESGKINFSGYINHSADILVFSQNIDDQPLIYPCSVNASQDYSYLLYRPIIQSNCHFMVKRSFLERIFETDRDLLRQDPNWIFYKYNAHVVGTLLKTKARSVVAIEDTSSIDDFERLYFHRSLSLYKDTKLLNKTNSSQL